MNLRQIKRLINIVEESKIDELFVEDDGIKIKIRKNVPQKTSATVISPTPSIAQITPEVSLQPSQESSTKQPNKDQDGEIVKADIVGTFYRSASPDSGPYVKIGDKVSKGQTLCIIEAMKIMNEIPSPVDGVVDEILVENAQPIEYGEPLFRIKK